MEEEEELVKIVGSSTGVFIPGIGSIPSAVLIVGSVRTSSGTSSNLVKVKIVHFDWEVKG